jgi:hypothetical protein
MEGMTPSLTNLEAFQGRGSNLFLERLVDAAQEMETLIIEMQVKLVKLLDLLQCFKLQSEQLELPSQLQYT